MQRSFWIRLATFVLWLLAAASAVYWGLRFVQGSPAPNSAVSVQGISVSAVDPGALARGLGGGKQPVASAANPNPAPVSSIAASRFVLTGVVVARTGQASSSVALIGVDGKPARPYRVGTSLTDGVVLHSVAAGQAMLSANMQTEPSTTLQLPQLTTAVAGTAMVSQPAQPIVARPANPTAAPSSLGNRPARPLASRPREARQQDQ
ncbi:MAG: hypothetical protein HC765_10810 [Brachymonas sp.]|nr:hypothetical protein [Brachymonas sp.]